MGKTTVSGFKSNFKLKHYINYIVIALFLVVMMILSGNGMLPRATITLLSRIAYSIILAVSLNLVVGFLGELSLGHAGFMCVGAYIGCYFANYLHTVIGSPLVVLILSMLVGGAVAAVFGFVIGLPALRLKGDYLAIVTLAFGEIVRNVDLDIREGEILGIGGLAGQGKLGIPNGVMGLYEAGGTVEFDGKPIPLNAPRRCLDAQLAFVSEDRRGVGLLLDESLEWNIAFPAMQIHDKFLKSLFGGLVKWRDEKAIRAVTDRYIDELKIKCTSSKQKAKELSGGNQQKVCLAKAFALEPKFLFVSEPTRGIDVGAKSLVLDALKRFNRESGITVVMISSELEELRMTCDRIAIVSGGRIAGILPATESSEAFGMLMVSQVK